MTSEDYESFTPAHKAMSSFFHGSRFFMVNVECIGSDLLVQHYELVDHSKSHVKFYSAHEGLRVSLVSGDVLGPMGDDVTAHVEPHVRADLHDRRRFFLRAPRRNRLGNRGIVLH